MQKRPWKYKEPQVLEDIEEEKRLLGLLLRVEGNYALYRAVKDMIDAFPVPEEWERMEGASQDDIKAVIAHDMLNRWVFFPCEMVFLFQNDPFKVLKWIRSFLKQFHPNLGQDILNLILQVLNASAKRLPLSKKSKGSWTSPPVSKATLS